MRHFLAVAFVLILVMAGIASSQNSSWSDYASALTRKETTYLMKADSLFESGRRVEARDQYSLACKSIIPRAVRLDSTAFRMSNYKTKGAATDAIQSTIAMRRVVKYATLRMQATFNGEPEKNALQFVVDQLDSTINEAIEFNATIARLTDETFQITAAGMKFREVLKAADPNEDYFATVNWNRRILIIRVVDGWYTLADSDRKTYTKKLLLDWMAVLDVKTLSGVGIRMVDINGDTLASCGPDNFQKVQLLH